MMSTFHTPHSTISECIVEYLNSVGQSSVEASVEEACSSWMSKSST